MQRRIAAPLVWRASATLAATTTGCLTPCARSDRLRWQSAFGRSRAAPPPPSSAAPAPALPPRVSLCSAAERPPPPRPNATGDDELSLATRAAMRDDAIILSALSRHIPPNGAISVKSLAAQLSPDVQEALSELHGGLHAFLEKRKQFFLVRPRPEDKVLFVAATPLATQMFAVREMQKTTMRQMLGLPEDGMLERGGPRGGRGGSGGGNRRGFSGRGGGAGGQRGRGARGGYDGRRDGSGGRGRGGGDYRERPPMSQRGGHGSAYGRAGGSGSYRGRGQPGQAGSGSAGRTREGPIGSREYSFGSRGGS